MTRTELELSMEETAFEIFKKVQPNMIEAIVRALDAGASVGAISAVAPLNDTISSLMELAARHIKRNHVTVKRCRTCCGWGWIASDYLPDTPECDACNGSGKIYQPCKEMKR